MININIEEREVVIILHVFGNLSMDTADTVEISWRDQLAKKPEAIALNFNGLEFIDSIGISCLIRLTKNAVLKNVELIFYDLSEPIETLFKTARINKYFNIMTKEDFESYYF